jgi:hypothetical protein
MAVGKYIVDLKAFSIWEVIKSVKNKFIRTGLSFCNIIE